MCTISWQREEDAYTLLFNRDEQRTRKDATPPECLRTESTPYLAALDGQAGGTWLAVNEHGLSAAILNFYRHDHQPTESGTHASRGRIPGLLMDLESPGDAEALLRQEVANESYRPFLCVVFNRETEQLYSWDGNSLEKSTPSPPMTTSGFDSERVESGRLQLFRDKFSEDSLLEFHSSHEPEKGPYSVCMHRDDACSRSLSRIEVQRDQVTYDYLPTSPCTYQEEPWISVSLSKG